MVSIPYLVERRGKWFWTPRGAAAKAVPARPLGSDPQAAQAQALRLYQLWQAVRRGDPSAAATGAPRELATAAKAYPAGSVGEAFQRWIRTDPWKALSPKTRNGEWWPAWRLRIEPYFGQVAPRTITLEQLAQWRADVLERDGLDAAHRAIKIWRRLFNVMGALGYALPPRDPSLAIRNTAPRPRAQRWSEGEVVRLAKGAWRIGYRGLACVIAVAWDTQFSPIDVRTLRARHRARDGARLYFDLMREGRGKTGKAALGTISARTERLVGAYLDGLGVELTDEAFLFRNRSGRAYREDTLADDFAAVRKALFGASEKRQMRDLRRSGALEAVAGGVSDKALADKMANSIDRAGFLQKTYTPAVEISVVQMADAARLRGRRKIRERS